MSTTYHYEIIELHEFFQEWLGGTLQNTDENFARFLDVIGNDFTIIAPDGNLTECERLTQLLRTGNGADPGIRIWIENIRLLQQHADLMLVLYEEWQTRGNETKGRLSSVLFRQKSGTPNNLEWLHVHETWLPVNRN